MNLSKAAPLLRNCSLFKNDRFPTPKKASCLTAIFGYGRRVSTKGQATENQRLETELAGSAVEYLFADSVRQPDTHRLASLYQAFEPAAAMQVAHRIELVHTPKHGSWLNMAESELSRDATMPGTADWRGRHR